MSKLTLKKSHVFASAIAVSSLSAGIAKTASAADLFGATELSAGYQVAMADGKCGEAKCGGNKVKAKVEEKVKEGSCGGNKAKEGSCGSSKSKEGSCGANKSKEGSCGANKAKAVVEKAKEGKCGEGKCGGKK